jgi:3-isopropylmalate/(R)-2-methylmalate dehydratase small subunit
MGFVNGFSTHSGKIAVYNVDNVDTDRIIPARFLTMVTKSGYGELLFKDVRGPAFPLDNAASFGASILVVGSNFGCGSSREHAVWAIQQAGFRCVIGKETKELPGYSDIFRQNAANCGLLLIELTESEHNMLANLGNGSTVTVDLPQQAVHCDTRSFKFEISQSSKEALLKGLDLIGSTLSYETEIAEFELKSTAFMPNFTAKRI